MTKNEKERGAFLSQNPDLTEDLATYLFTQLVTHVSGHTWNKNLGLYNFDFSIENAVNGSETVYQLHERLRATMKRKDKETGRDALLGGSHVYHPPKQ